MWLPGYVRLRGPFLTTDREAMLSDEIDKNDNTTVYVNWQTNSILYNLLIDKYRTDKFVNWQMDIFQQICQLIEKWTYSKCVIWHTQKYSKK